MKNTIIVIVVVILVILLGVWAYASRDNSGLNGYNQDDGVAKGEVVVSVTDAAADIEGVSEVTLTAEKAELYSNSRGWVSVDGGSKEFELLTLKNNAQSQLYGKAEVASDTYSKVRMTISRVEVTAKNGSVVRATVPNNRVEFAADVAVSAGKTTEAKFDFLVDKSLHMASSGEYVFAPVVKFDSKTDTTVTIGQNNIVLTSGGNVEGTYNFGMDLDGSMKADFELNTNSELKIENGTIINTNLDLSGSSSSGSNSSGKGGSASVSGSGSSSGVNTSSNINLELQTN